MEVSEFTRSPKRNSKRSRRHSKMRAISTSSEAGGVLEIEFENGTKMIINRHSAAREIWVAAKSGGFHFRPEGGRWVATRDGTELYALLSELVGEQSGTSVTLTAG